ncbi:hypothetical protein WL21_32535 [Burkholderia ubonensis]|uniref:hypothetical protein n=1 Tax=Burkholderia ubonensis TaxID=101571 RepID=UPI00075C1E6C|nr:hypothetical protein [Burkholderia ubonensis]KVO95545.1 hypothetical protein WJ81_02730 [Burkholderia ubonensis]KVZ58468.1 hypothetical protein WL20_22380 [Burkholderia ubonensis]KVZ75138.1 hypothetical protein WL21_32535 [Burkholderia ubonensis]
MKDLIISLVIDAAVLGSFAAWKMLGIASAGTFYVAMLWVFTVFMALAIFNTQRRPKRSGLLSWLRWVKGCVVSVLTILACIYAGLVALAVCYTVAWMFLQTQYASSEAA